MDKDNSNSCNWYEFIEAAKKIKFAGDVPGAWCAFDFDLSGEISLKEIDPEAYRLLLEFKIWADTEFGGVRPAFKTIDADKSNQINFREFRSACRSFGFKGDILGLFESLDQTGNKHVLVLDEVAFLDEWDPTEDSDLCPVDVDAEAPDEPSQKSDLASRRATPGPGAYSIDSSFAAGPTVPGARHRGAFSFGQRLRKAWSKPRIGPDKYDAHTDCSRQMTKQRRPAWSFGGRDGPPPQTLHVVPSMMPQSTRRGSATSTSLQFSSSAAGGARGDGSQNLPSVVIRAA